MASLVEEAVGLDFSSNGLGSDPGQDSELHLENARRAAREALEEKGVKGAEKLLRDCPSVGHILNEVMRDSPSFEAGVNLFLS